MTQQNLVIDGPNGRVAIYEGPQSDAIEADPLTDLSKVTFHTGLGYVGFQRVRKTYTVPAVSQNNYVNERINLGAHGKGFTPIVFAILRGWVNGDGTPVDLPICGGLMLDFYGQRPGDTGTFKYAAPVNTFDRWTAGWPSNGATSYDNSWNQKAWLLGAGADGSDLFVWYEQATWNETGATYPATTLTMDFYVGNRSVDGVGGDAAPDALFDSSAAATTIQSTRLTVSGSEAEPFSSANSYLHADASNPDIAIPVSQAFLFGRTAAGAAFTEHFAIKASPQWLYDVEYRRSFSPPTAPTPPDGSFQGVSF